MHSEEINEIAAALAKAQGAMAPAGKDATNPHLRSSYASLAGIWEACRKPLADNGLAVIQTVTALDQVDEGPTLVTTLAHESGQYFKSYLRIQPQPQKGTNPTQQFGSAMTYARRYALAAIVGISVSDDDGHAATNGQSRPASKPDHKHSQKAQPQRPPAAAKTNQSNKPKNASTIFWEKVRELEMWENGEGQQILEKAGNNFVTAFDMLPQPETGANEDETPF